MTCLRLSSDGYVAPPKTRQVLSDRNATITETSHHRSYQNCAILSQHDRLNSLQIRLRISVGVCVSILAVQFERNALWLYVAQMFQVRGSVGRTALFAWLCLLLVSRLTSCSRGTTVWHHVASANKYVDEKGHSRSQEPAAETSLCVPRRLKGETNTIR